MTPSVKYVIKKINEFHFLFICPVVQEYRKRLVKEYRKFLYKDV